MSTHSQAEICSKKKSALSLNGEKMKAILDRTRYSLGVSRGQRKYFTSREAVKQLNSLEIAPGTELIVNISEPITCKAATAQCAAVVCTALHCTCLD